jgi:hypothetical protein
MFRSQVKNDSGATYELFDGRCVANVAFPRDLMETLTPTNIADPDRLSHFLE